MAIVDREVEGCHELENKHLPVESVGRLAAEVLAQAGGAVSLTEGARRLGISNRALQVAIAAREVLGLTSGRDIILPEIQLQEFDGTVRVLPGIREITRLFHEAKAGPWMQLQFLVEHDPNLSAAPITALRDGRTEDVIIAARAHLHLDEDCPA